MKSHSVWLKLSAPISKRHCVSSDFCLWNCEICGTAVGVTCATPVKSMGMVTTRKAYFRNRHFSSEVCQGFAPDNETEARKAAVWKVDPWEMRSEVTCYLLHVSVPTESREGGEPQRKEGGERNSFESFRGVNSYIKSCSVGGPNWYLRNNRRPLVISVTIIDMIVPNVTYKMSKFWSKHGTGFIPLE